MVVVYFLALGILLSFGTAYSIDRMMAELVNAEIGDLVCSDEDEEAFSQKRREQYKEAFVCVTASDGYGDLLKMLCGESFDVNARDEAGMTLIQRAIEAKSERNVVLLLLFDAQLDFIDDALYSTIEGTPLGVMFNAMLLLRRSGDYSWKTAICRLYPAIVDPIQEGIAMCKYRISIQSF